MSTEVRGELRFYIDYRALNAATIKNRCPTPLINKTLGKLSLGIVSLNTLLSLLEYTIRRGRFRVVIIAHYKIISTSLVQRTLPQ